MKQPNCNGWWEWREGGRDQPEKLLLVADGREVASDDDWELATGRSPEHKTYSDNYWEGTATTQAMMPGSWKYIGPAIDALGLVVDGTE